MKPTRPAAAALPARAWCFLLYACLAGLCVTVHNRLIDSVATDARRTIHEQVIRGTAPAPLQYRVMTFYAAEGVRRAARAAGAKDPFRASYLLLRWLATLAAAILLHQFLRLYFPLPAALGGTVLFFAWLPFTYINYYMQESDPANMVFYLAGYLLIRRRRDGALALLTAAAMLNRETPVLLPLVWLLYRWDELPVGAAAARFAGLCAAAFGVYFGLRAALGHSPAYAEFNDLMLNVKSPNSYVYFLLLFGALAGPMRRGYAAAPKFLRRLALFLPFFLVFHFVIPIFQETRLFLPIVPIAIALALAAFTEARPEAFAEEERPAVSPLAGRAKPLYFAALLLFVGGIFLYLFYLEKTHVGELREKQKAERHMKDGFRAFEAKDAASAARSWEWALLYDPGNFDAHYNLAVVYGEHLFETTKAREHLRACLEASPEDPKLKGLAARLDDLDLRRERIVREGGGL